MNSGNGRKRRGVISWVIGALFLVPGASAGSHKDYLSKRSDADIPVPLAAGTVRSPEFPSNAEWYDILVVVGKPFPMQQMRCMMGVTLGPLDSKNCTSNDPLLRAEWKVWEGKHVVDQGSIPNRCACIFEN